MIDNDLKTRFIERAAIGAFALFAFAQTAEAQVQPTPPEHYTLDERGVDLVTGRFVYQATDIVIGQPGNGGITHTRVWTNGGWRDALSGTIAVSGSAYVVSLGAESEVFTKSGSTFTPVSNTGATLTQSGPLLTFNTANGTIATYSTTYSGSTTVYAANNAALMSVKRPNGETLAFHWDGYSYCRLWDLDPLTGEPGQCLDWANAVRLDAVSNNRGYQVNFEYAAEDIPFASGPHDWLRRTAAIGINRTVDHCDPYAHCTGSRTWPRVDYSSGPVGGHLAAVTDQSGRTTSYAYGAGLTGVRLPGSPTDDIAVSYTGGRVSAVTDVSGAWTYAYADMGATRTTTATGPLSHQLVVVSDQTIGRATSVTNALNQTVSYAYDSQRRLQRVTRPEGDYAEVAYDTRGNITLTTHTPKSGSGLSNIVTSATYPSICSNPVICNLPTSTTDAHGNVTDYTWDSVHGGLLTITQPAPSVGADRPQTRFIYAAQTAYYKNTAGAIVASATSVTLPTVVSACATGTSCANAANEVRTTVAYGSTGVANNLLPTSLSQGSGASPAMAVTAMTWTPDSDLESVDGPLSGAADTSHYRYDNARQLIGVIGPDPDGGGAGLNRAHRLTYNSRGQVILAETGTAQGGVWTNFSPLLKNQTSYDAAAFSRPVETRQLSAANAVSGVQQVSYDAAGRSSCTAVRMNPATWGSLPTSACTAVTAGSFGPDRIAQMTYDAAGRPLTTTSALGLAEAITEGVTYTANGQVTSLTDGNGNVSVLEYDGFDRPVRLRYPIATGGGTSTTDYEEVGYDAASNVVSSRNRAGQTTTVGYDALNRPTTLDAPSGTMDLAWTYDNLDRVLTSTGNSQTLTHVWDPLSRLTSETGPLGAMTYQHDAAGRMTRITWPDAFYAVYDHDLYGAVTAVRENGATSGAGVLAIWAYDNLGLPTGVTRGNGAATNWGYDAFARLTSLVQNPDGSSEDVTLGFGYNPAGQIFSRTVSNPAYVYAPITGTTAYDLDGLNRVTEIDNTSVTYDANRNTTGIAGNGYGYDAANRLTSAHAGSGSATFAFDPSDRLYQASVGAASTRFQYAGVQMAAEYDGTGVLVRRHIPGLGLDGVVTSYDGSGTGSRSWLLADERGSVIALTGATGAVSTINRYDEYGVPASGNVGRFGYTGQAWLAEAGAWHYRARTYLPQVGRFLQTDPIGYSAGANLYAYVGGDPVNFIDPLGLNPDADCIITVIYRRNSAGQIVPVSQADPNCEGNDDAARRGPVRGGFHPGLFGSGSPGTGGGSSGFGYMPPFNSVQNDPAFAPYQAERLQQMQANSAPVYILMAVFAAPAAAEMGLLRMACKCFEADTLVATDQGPRSIQNIKVGDEVLSRDEVTGETAFKPVVALIAGAESQIWEVIVEINAEGMARREMIGATDDHPWRLVGGGWAETAELYPGAELVTASGTQAVVVSVVRTDRVEQTYNFEVEGFHTYFVGEAELWVHNACDPSRLTYLYQKVSMLGQHLKIGITSNPVTRYTQRQLAGGRLRIVASGRRDEMLALERHLHRNLPRGRDDGRGP